MSLLTARLTGPLREPSAHSIMDPNMHVSIIIIIPSNSNTMDGVSLSLSLSLSLYIYIYIYIYIYTNSQWMGYYIPTIQFVIDSHLKRHEKTIFTSNFNPNAGSYPVAINLGVSPPGSHSLGISIEDDEGFQATAIVPYFIEEGSNPTGWLNNN